MTGIGWRLLWASNRRLRRDLRQVRRELNVARSTLAATRHLCPCNQKGEVG